VWLPTHFLGSMLIVFMDADCMYGVVPAPLIKSKPGQEDSAPGERPEQKVQYGSGVSGLGAGVGFEPTISLA
jgi:hypothetical protein